MIFPMLNDERRLGLLAPPAGTVRAVIDYVGNMRESSASAD